MIRSRMTPGWGLYPSFEGYGWHHEYVPVITSTVKLGYREESKNKAKWKKVDMEMHRRQLSEGGDACTRPVNG